MSGYQALREEKSSSEKSVSPYSADGAWENTPFTAHEAKLEWEVPENLVETLVGENAANLSPEQIQEITQVITDFKDLWDAPEVRLTSKQDM